jgi:hypothetical protein
VPAAWSRDDRAVDLGHRRRRECGGADIVQQRVNAGLLDGLAINRVPVLLGEGHPTSGSSLAFVEATEAMVGDVDAVLITGFWLSACVAATAASCAQRLAGRVPVVVPLSLAATRLGLYDPGDDHPAVVDVTTRLAQLRAGGVVVCDAPDAWRSQLTDR